MTSIISSLLKARIAGMLSEAKELEAIPHSGLRGRFRELLVAKLITPVLPSTCTTMHGTVIDFEGKRFEAGAMNGKIKTEDDVLIIDKETIAPVLFSITDGIVPAESVIVRIEVKSKLTSTELRDALIGAAQFKSLSLVIDDVAGAATIQILFAYNTDLTFGGKSEIERLQEMIVSAGLNPNDPPIQGLCVIGRGCWIYGASAGDKTSGWKGWLADPDHVEVLAFLGTLINTLPKMRETRRSARLGTYIVDMSKLINFS